jgi:hypothetical protein
LSNLASKVKEFVGGEGELEGAMFDELATILSNEDLPLIDLSIARNFPRKNLVMNRCLVR